MTIDPTTTGPSTGTPRTRFSASEAAFAGFRLAAREPLTVLIWGGLVFVLSLAMGASMVAIVGPQMTALMAAGSAGATPPDPAVIQGYVARLLPFEGVAIVLSLLFSSVIYAAVNRAVLRPGKGAPGRLGLGAAELNQLLTLLILGVVLFVVYIAAIIVGVVVGIVLGIAAGGAAAAGGGSAGSAAAAMAGPIVLVIFGVALLVFAIIMTVFTRLSLAMALTFDLGRVEVFGSWTMTKGMFWPLLGAYLLAGLLMMVLYIVGAILFAVIALAAGGGMSAAGVMFKPNTASLGSYFSAFTLLWLVFASALGGLWIAVSAGAPAQAYAQLKAMGRGPAGTVPPASPVSDLPRFGN